MHAPSKAVACSTRLGVVSGSGSSTTRKSKTASHVSPGSSTVSGTMAQFSSFPVCAQLNATEALDFIPPPPMGTVFKFR